jgi:hypothetical protein
MRVAAGDHGFDNVLRYLDSQAEAVVMIGTRGPPGCAAVGPDQVVGRLGLAGPPWPIVQDARPMPEKLRACSEILRPERGKRPGRCRGLDAITARGWRAIIGEDDGS